jgi:hypothetical protein
MAGLTAKGLDPLVTAMLAIANESMDVSIGDPEVGALSVGTGVALCVDLLRCSPAAFHLAPGTRNQHVLALHSTREWSRDDKQGNRLGSAA